MERAHNANTPNMRFWQWPNILAFDASAIALAWLWIFAAEQCVTLPAGAYAVLALSVWLTYLSDRLLDAGQRPASDLLSQRHRFAKRHRSALWQLWSGVLMLNLWVAANALDAAQLQRGFGLLEVLLCHLPPFFAQLSRAFERLHPANWRVGGVGVGLARL